MAQVVLSSVGAALGGPVGGAIGSAVGSYIDQAAIGALRPARVGPRLEGVRVTSTAEGAPMAAVFGRARVAGQVIWAANFREQRSERRSGGKGGGRTVEHRYSLSFAVALCEGPIDGVGRVWADGRPMDMTGVVMRVHPGGEDQTPDALMEAVEGVSPAFRGTAYVVFEDLPLEPYGNRAPNLSFEVFRRPRGAEPGLEERLTGVCLIPGAGEFVYATEAVLRRSGLTRSTAENVNNTEGRPDFLVSLDQLEAQLPKVRSVTLVVSWFGDDLRMGECTIRPGVERADKLTLPRPWRAGGVDRAGARLISETDGRPNYGGTPSDACVLQAITELKARGSAVTLYPFVMMDVPPGNGRPDPYGGPEQAAFPWRGRITTTPGTDKTSAAGPQVTGFFGSAVAAHFTVADGEPRYGGPAGWRYRRMVLHYAKLAQIAGGVDGFLIGSELRGVTTARASSTAYPGVTQLRSLATECRTLLGPGCQISYAADWTEWFGHQPADGTGDVRFRLDPLWADPNINYVGIDWYPPLADQRDGEPRPSVPELQAAVAGGERYDWYYASDADRAAGVRSPITDGAYGEPWVFRAKDLHGWWSNLHRNRPGGVRVAGATAWVPRSKPIRLVEFGCPAADKGANAPNLFHDPKSAESALPPFSDGGRDDLGQRRALEAVLAHFADAGANPVSPVYGGPMVDALSAWCWDARPFPDFPGREEVWSDGANWALGHWLNGRAGVAPAQDLVRAVLARGGVGDTDVDAGEVTGSVAGFVVDRPMALRDALAPLATAFAFEAAEADGRVRLAARDGAAEVLGAEALAWPEDAAAPQGRSRRLEPGPDAVRVRFSDETAEYQTGAAGASTEAAEGGGTEHLDLPLVADAETAERIAARRLRQARAERETATVHVGPLEALRRTPGDRLAWAGGLWRVARAEADEQPRLLLMRMETADAEAARSPGWTPAEAARASGPPVLHVLDLPGLPGAETDARPLIAAAAEPWRPLEVWAGSSAEALSVRARADAPATVGELLEALPPRAPGTDDRWDRSSTLVLRLEGRAPESRSTAAVLAGANALAVRARSGEWEVLAFETATPVGPETWALTGLLRAGAGTDSAAAETKPAGAPVVVLDADLPRAEVAQAERGTGLSWRAAPAGGPAAGPGSASVEATWRALQLRPWSPVGLAAEALAGGDVRLSWVRRSRLHGDGWAGEPPLSEAAEAYLAEVLDGAGAVVRSWETRTAAVVYGAAELAADWGTRPASLRLRVRQGSAGWGWGAAAERVVGG